jgi:hypothetical protein
MPLKYDCAIMLPFQFLRLRANAIAYIKSVEGLSLFVIPVTYFFSYWKPWMKTSIKGNWATVHLLFTLEVLSDRGLLLWIQHGELTAIHHLKPSASSQKPCGRCLFKSQSWTFSFALSCI